MINKRDWLLNKLLIPAGILPPAITYDDLVVNEENRLQIGNIGFEYVLLMNQDPAKVNKSAIGKKIYAVHAPFPAFGHSSFGGNKFLIELVTNIVYGKQRIPNNFNIIAEKTFSFAKNVGAKVVIFHTYHFNNIQENLKTLANWEFKTNIKPLIEHEGNYEGNIAGQLQDWQIYPEKMINFLDNIFPQKKFQICLDTSSLYGHSISLINSVEKIWPRVGHLHLAGSLPGFDLATEISQPEIVELVDFFYQKKYKGYINAEVNGTVGKKEELIAQIYGGSSILKFPILKKLAVANAQKHIANSCFYLLNNIDA